MADPNAPWHYYEAACEAERYECYFEQLEAAVEFWVMVEAHTADADCYLIAECAEAKQAALHERLDFAHSYNRPY